MLDAVEIIDNSFGFLGQGTNFFFSYSKVHDHMYLSLHPTCLVLAVIKSCYMHTCYLIWVKWVCNQFNPVNHLKEVGCIVLFSTTLYELKGCVEYRSYTSADPLFELFDHW